MSDDLVKRLRSSLSVLAQEEAADRIEELEAENAKLKQMWWDAGDVTDLAGTIADLEAKLAKAVELVERAFNEGVGSGMDDVLKQSGGRTWYDSRSRKRLEELKGQDDE